ncbi:hypothetical protein [Methylocystis sp. ATCC 49242]|uniref:hypothetical protein n=1 Tax=Methylocystis sp. ATCC 49242 TaxID=622637 RepID=UPI0003105D4D|nr:hypothetical protein [Methylocystis sp. ATCC 49242]
MVARVAKIRQLGSAVILRWLRLFISTLIIAAALIGAIGASYAAPSAHSCAQMVMDDCPDGHGDAVIPIDCDPLLCGAWQLPPSSIALSPVSAAFSRLAYSREELRLRGLLRSPDLRPPIA